MKKEEKNVDRGLDFYCGEMRAEKRKSNRPQKKIIIISEYSLSYALKAQWNR